MTQSMPTSPPYIEGGGSRETSGPCRTPPPPFPPQFVEKSLASAGEMRDGPPALFVDKIFDNEARRTPMG